MKRRRSSSKKTKYWIQEATGKKGSLSRQMGIPEKDNIPITLLEKIRIAKIGSKIKNPTKCGKKEYKVTRLLKRRAVMALNLKRLKK